MVECDIYIASHERYEAIEAWKDLLTKAQIEEIEENDCNWLFLIKSDNTITIIPEG